MNIAFVEPHLAVCGGIRRIHEVANGLVRLGNNVDISIPDHVFDDEQVGGWMLKLFNVIPERDLLKNKYDIVIFNEETQYPIARSVNATKRIFYVLHWAVLHKDFNTLRSAYNGGFHLIANSNWTADCMYLETGSKPPVHFGGIDHEVFKENENIEKEFDTGTYGASRFWKGAWIAEEVAAKLKLSLFKFGDSSGINQEKLGEAYSKCKVWISPSYYEGWNWCGLEAMACGVPLVISDDGGSEDYALDGVNCLRFPARRVDLAIKAVERILKDKRLKYDLINEGLRTAKEYNWERSAKNFENILKEIYGRK